MALSGNWLCRFKAAIGIRKLIAVTDRYKC